MRASQGQSHGGSKPPPYGGGTIPGGVTGSDDYPKGRCVLASAATRREQAPALQGVWN